MTFRRLVFVLALAFSLAVAAACHKNPPPQAPAPPVPPPSASPTPPPAPRPPAPTAAPTPAPLTEQEMFNRKSLAELSAELSDVYFDLDKAEVRDDARPALQKNADWMKKWTSTQVTVEGHCDSRGSSEYNLALGTRRATAVRDYLVNLGVPVARLTVVSKGKEQPMCTEQTEACWQQNRRAHFVVTAK
jgi:peptidoglycan-associated lipoprotein